MARIDELSAAELAQRYAAQDLSPVEVVGALLERIDRWEPLVNAMFRLDRDGALAQAGASERRWRKGSPLSLLDGVPVTIKENIATRGDPSPIGTRANEHLAPAPADAPPAARLREAGCVLLGKTAMPDYGMLSSGLSSLHGVTRNPWRLERNPSGSSSGAGAAAAARYAPLHGGTDIGGSVRLPATHCGIFGLKPSLGRVPVHPPYIGRVAGPMTRSVEDAAIMMDVLARPDPRDFMSLPYEGLRFADRLAPVDPTGLRIGVLADMRVGLAVHPAVCAATRAAARALESAGAIVEEVPAFLTTEALDGMCRFFEARSFNDLAELAPERRAKVLPFIVEWCSWRASRFSGRDVMAAYESYVSLREVTVAACQPYDYVVSPTSPILPYAATDACPGNDPHNALLHIAFTVPYNMSEQPAASINWTYSTAGLKDENGPAGGLPIGVQIIGRRFDDLGVLRVARTVEDLRPAQQPWPEPG